MRQEWLKLAAVARHLEAPKRQENGYQAPQGWRLLEASKRRRVWNPQGRLLEAPKLQEKIPPSTEAVASTAVASAADASAVADASAAAASKVRQDSNADAHQVAKWEAAARKDPYIQQCQVRPQCADHLSCSDVL